MLIEQWSTFGLRPGKAVSVGQVGFFGEFQPEILEGFYEVSVLQKLFIGSRIRLKGVTAELNTSLRRRLEPTVLPLTFEGLKRPDLRLISSLYRLKSTSEPNFYQNFKNSDKNILMKKSHQIDINSSWDFLMSVKFMPRAIQRCVARRRAVSPKSGCETHCEIPIRFIRQIPFFIV